MQGIPKNRREAHFPLPAAPESPEPSPPLRHLTRSVPNGPPESRSCTSPRAQRPAGCLQGCGGCAAVCVPGLPSRVCVAAPRGGSHVTDPLLMEACIYEINALRAKYNCAVHDLKNLTQ